MPTQRIGHSPSIGTIERRVLGEKGKAGVNAAVKGCVDGAGVGLVAGAISGVDETGWGAIGSAGIGCARGARFGGGAYAFEQTGVPGAKFTVEAVSWGLDAKEVLGAAGTRFAREGFVFGFGLAVERTPTGARFVWGLLIGRAR
jgi:hypothetical protein